MMQRSHPKESPSSACRSLGHLKKTHLQHDRKSLNNKNTANHHEHEFLFSQHRHSADGAANRQAANVTHKDLSRRSVVPEKPETGAGHGAAKNRQLRRFGTMS